MRRIAFLSVAVLCTTTATAQPLRTQLDSLLSTPPPDLVVDPIAAAISADTLLTLFGIELSSAPVTSGTSGFIYELNPALGVPQRAGDGFGPFFTERTLRSGEGQLSLGVVMQEASFSTLSGQSLTRGDLPVTLTRAPGDTQALSGERLRLQLSARTLTLRTLYGITDRLDVGAAVPFVQVRIDGARVSTRQGVQTFELLRDGRTSGIGDVGLTARLRVLGARASGLAVGLDTRLPTGSANDLLGTGQLAARAQAIASLERRRLALSGNLGAGAGGASPELFASTAVTVAPTGRLTLVGEVLMRRLARLHPVAPVYAPHSTAPALESMRWVADTSSAVSLGYAVVGAKWNVSGPLLVGAHVLVRFTDAGLRARMTPTVTIDYDFTP